MKSDEKSHFQKIRNCAPLEALWGGGSAEMIMRNSSLMKSEPGSYSYRGPNRDMPAKMIMVN